MTRVRTPYKAENSVDTATKVHVPKNKKKEEKRKAIEESLNGIE